MAEAEAINYVVVCARDHQMEAVAYVDDNRPIGGSITVSAPTPEAKQIISGVGYHPEIENWRPPEGYVERKWADRNVSETVWDWNEGRTGWTIRCGRCHDQAQIPGARLVDIADTMAANRNPDALVPSPDPVSADDTGGCYDSDGWFIPEVGGETVAKWQQRYMVQLRVLVDQAQRNM
jgi:hypothetical protein